MSDTRRPTPHQSSRSDCSVSLSGAQLKLQRHTAAAIVEQFSHDHIEEVVCNIAGWHNQDNNGSYLTVELSPRFVARTPIEQDDIIRLHHQRQEENIEAI